MKLYLQTHAEYFKKREFLIPFFVSFGMLIVANIINFYAGTYATVHASNAVTDIILNNIRVFDVDAYFVYGTLTFWVFLVFTWFHHIDRLPFSVKSVSLFIVIRSVFITLTHIGPFADQIKWTSYLISKWSFGGDLFFSGHTGIPFLFALIFWDIKPLRIIFLCSSVFFATIVLLGHLHYSIDVLSAFFITFTIYCMSKYIFKKDLALFENKATV